MAFDPQSIIKIHGKQLEKCSFDHRWHFRAPPNMLVFVSFCAHVGEANGFKLSVFVVALDPQSIMKTLPASPIIPVVPTPKEKQSDKSSSL